MPVNLANKREQTEVCVGRQPRARWCAKWVMVLEEGREWQRRKEEWGRKREGIRESLGVAHGQ